MVSVTLLAFLLSLRQKEAILSLIGAIGGLGTPFLLYTETGSLPGLIGYTCLLLSGTSAIYFYQGWRTLLWSSVIGGWLVFLVGLTQGLPSEPYEALSDRWALQLGVVFGWLAFSALPVIREILSIRNPVRWPRPVFPNRARSLVAPPDVASLPGLGGGHIFHGECLPPFMWSKRLAYRTPMPGVFLCGAGTYPGGSVIGINGRNGVAEAVLKPNFPHFQLDFVTRKMLINGRSRRRPGILTGLARDDKNARGRSNKCLFFCSEFAGF